jgi:hypothetical protein
MLAHRGFLDQSFGSGLTVSKFKEKEHKTTSRMSLCVLLHPMDAERHNIPPGA